MALAVGDRFRRRRRHRHDREHVPLIWRRVIRLLRAALRGAQQIGFTVVSICVSLIAAFIPLLFMGGVVGRLFREFSVTLCLCHRGLDACCRCRSRR